MASMYIDVESTTFQPGETIYGTLHVMVRNPTLPAKCIHLVLRATETASIRSSLSAAKKGKNGLYPNVKYTEKALYMQEVSVLLGSMDDGTKPEVLTRGHYQYPFRVPISTNAPPSYYCSMPMGASSKLSYHLGATLVVDGDINPQTSVTVRVSAAVTADYVSTARELVTRTLPKKTVSVAKGGKIDVGVEMQPWVAVLEKYESEALTREDTFSSVRSSNENCNSPLRDKDQYVANAVCAHITITNESKEDIKEVYVVARQRQHITLDNASSTTRYIPSIERPTVEEVTTAKNNSITGEDAMCALESLEADGELLPDEECINTRVDIDTFHQEASMETRIANVTLTDLPDDAIKPGQTVTLTARLKLPRETRTTYVQHKGVPLPSISTSLLQTATVLEVSFPGVEIKGSPYTAEKAFFVASVVDKKNCAIDVPAKYSAAQKA